MKTLDNVRSIRIGKLVCIILFLISSSGQAKVSEERRTDFVCCYNNAFKEGIRSNLNKYFAKGWVNYEFANAFTLSVPNTVELRNKNDLYSQVVKSIRWHGYRINLDNVVFQQKGLSINSSEAFKTYCRVLVNYEKGNARDFYKATEYEELGGEEIAYVQEQIKHGCIAAGHRMVGEPNVCWVRIGKIYGLEIEYIRTGTEGNRVQIYTYSFFNDNETVTITLSYWVKDREKWEKDFQNIIRTFAWKKLK